MAKKKYLSLDDVKGMGGWDKTLSVPLPPNAPLELTGAAFRHVLEYIEFYAIDTPDECTDEDVKLLIYEAAPRLIEFAMAYRAVWKRHLAEGTPFEPDDDEVPF